MERQLSEALSPEALVAFAATIRGLSPDEIRDAKRLFVLNAITDYEKSRSQSFAFGFLQIVFAIIPFFWPILLMQRWSINTELKAQKTKISNAISIWRESLGDAFVVEIQQRLG
jgi:hypothetical protein